MSGGTPYEFFGIKELTGGLNLKDSPLDLRRNELQIATNCTITSKGSLKRRDGYYEDSANEITNGEINNHYRWYVAGGTPKTVVSAIISSTTGKVYTYTTAGGYSEITGGSTLNASKVRFLDYKDTLFMWDGIHWQYTTDGATKADVVFDTTASGYKSTDMAIRLMEICDDRIFVVFNAYPNTVFFSDYGGWNTLAGGLLFPTTNYFNIRRRSEDYGGITGLKNYTNNDELLVTRQNDTSVLLGVGSTDYTLRTIRGNAGCVSYDGMVESDDGRILVVGNNNIYLVEGDTMTGVGDKIDKRVRGWNLSNSIAMYDKARQLIYVTHPTGTLVWNISRFAFDERPVLAWTEYSLKMSCGTAYNSVADNGTFYFNVPGSTKMMRMGGVSDAGSSFLFDIETMAFDMNAWGEEKKFRAVATVQDAVTEEPFDVTLNIDNGYRSETKTMVIEIYGSKWGTAAGAMVWGTDKWTSSARTNGRLPMQGKSGAQFSIRIKDTSTNPLTINRIAVEFDMENRERKRRDVNAA